MEKDSTLIKHTELSLHRYWEMRARGNIYTRLDLSLFDCLLIVLNLHDCAKSLHTILKKIKTLAWGKMCQSLIKSNKNWTLFYSI